MLTISSEKGSGVVGERVGGDAPDSRSVEDQMTSFAIGVRVCERSRRNFQEINLVLIKRGTI